MATGANGVKKRGYAFFILNVGTKPEPTDKSLREPQTNTLFEYREGAEKDLDYLQSAFGQPGMGFEWANSSPEWYRDLTADKWDHGEKKTGKRANRKLNNNAIQNTELCCLKCHIQSLDYSDCEYFLLAIASHGNEIRETEIQFINNKFVPLSKIYDVLESVEELKSIPKILILQICRVASESKKKNDEVEDKGVFPDGSGDNRGKKASGSRRKFKCPSSDEDSDEEDTYSAGPIPHNFLIIFPAWHGQRSRRNATKGSWLLKELKTAMDRARETSLSSHQPCNLFHVITQATGVIAEEYQTKVYKRDKYGELVLDRNGKPVEDLVKSGSKSAVTMYHTLTDPITFYFSQDEQ